METKKVSKWDAAPESIKNMRELVNALYDPLPDEQNPIIDALSKVLDDYNELEAKHQSDCGLISDYAEENARLKQKNEKASNDIRDLRRALEENDIATYLNPVTVSWGVSNIALQRKTEHFNTQLDNLREKLKETEKKLKETERSRNNWHAHYVDMSDICSRDEDDNEMLQALLKKDGYTIEYDGDIDDETVRCQEPIDICRETTPDEVTLQYGRWTLRRPQNFSEAKANADAAILRNQLEQQRAQTDAFSKSNNDLRRRLLDLRYQLSDNGISNYWSSSSETNVLDFNDHDVRARASVVDILKEKINTYKEENETLKEKLNEHYGLCRICGTSSSSYLKWAAEKCNLENEISVLKKNVDILKEENKSLRDRIVNHDYGLCHICGWKANGKRKDKIIEELTVENNDLITDKKGLGKAIDAWVKMYNNMRIKRDSLKKENDGLREVIKNFYGSVDSNA